jgi:hypothetical protein
MQEMLTQFQQELILYFKARFTLIYVVTSEEERLLKEIAGACENLGKPAYSWDVADSFVPLTESADKVDRPAKDPLSALDMILKIDQDAVFVLKDFHGLWDKNHQITRKIKNLAQNLKQTTKNIIVTSHVDRVPDELSDQVYTIDYTPPDYDGIKQILDGFANIPNIKIKPYRPWKRPIDTQRPWSYGQPGRAGICKGHC